jgi:putative inorganic carbon (hco3(-)) transporter
MIKVLEFIIYWSIVLLPFSVAISTGMSNTLLGFLGFSFLAKKILKRERPFIHTPLNLVFLLFTAIALLSIRNSIDFKESLHGMEKIIKSGLIFLICASEIRSIEHIKKIVLSVACCISLVTIDGLWQLKFGWDFIRGYAVQSSPIYLARPTAAFPNPNVMGIYLSLISPLIIGLTFYYYKGRARLYFALVSLLAAIGTYITFSRGSGLGLFLALFFLAVMSKRKFLITALLAILLIFPFVMPQKIKNWAKEINYNPLIFLFNQDRLSMYMNTVNMVKHHPFIGVGVNTYSKNYARYKTERAEKYFHTLDGSYAQSNYFQMAGELGLVGLGFFLWFLWLLFRGLIRCYKAPGNDYLKIISLSLIASFFAFLINGLTESSLYYSRVAVMFWYFVGIALSLNKLIYERD